jgi:adenylosuccinate synthase
MLANNKVRTHLSRFMLIEPFGMMREAEALGKLTDNVWDRTTVDGNAVIITAFHRHLNRLREKERGASAHGSCGRGVGVAREMQLKFGDQVLLAKDTRNAISAFKKLQFCVSEMLPEIHELEAMLGIKDSGYTFDFAASIAAAYPEWPVRIIDGLEPAETMVFEGAQGVMLDEKHGTAPHNTWTNTTFENADTLLDEVGVARKDRTRIGCFRTYYTRHGAGPFPTEETGLDLPEPHNGDEGFQGKFRVGRFDYRMAEEALDIVRGVTFLAVSHLDYLPRLGVEEDEFLEHLVNELDTPVGIYGSGPTAAQRTINLGVTA